MKKKKYAMMFLNPLFLSIHRVRLDAGTVEHHIITVRNEAEAVMIAKKLVEESFGILELCGAFGEALAAEIYEAADHHLLVGYVIYPPEQEGAMNGFWQEENP